MTPREIDALVAEKVMGWKRMSWMDYHAPETKRYGGIDLRESLTYSWHDWTGGMTHNAVDTSDDNRPNDFTPSTDIAAAWTVVVELALSHLITIRTGGKLPKGATFNHRETNVTINGELTRADTAPMAICLAALKAVGVDV